MAADSLAIWSRHDGLRPELFTCGIVESSVPIEAQRFNHQVCKHARTQFTASVIDRVSAINGVADGQISACSNQLFCGTVTNLSRPRARS